MVTLEQILATRKTIRRKPDEEDLRRLPDRKALVKGRLSTFSQVKDSKESVREIAAQVGKAINDGYKTNLDPVKVERWLEDIQARVAQPGVLEDGEVIVNCLGLGVSGTLSEDKRPDLAFDMGLLRKGELGAIYVTEGANRLSRDPDRVVSSTLLKLMKDVNCKLRTPDEVLSPRVERDWEIIHDELERGAEELKGMNKRLHRRKAMKAARGEFVGEPIPPGFVVPIVGQKPGGSYVFGKMLPYGPHAEVDTHILREYVKQQGSALKTVQTLGDLSFPPFPGELSYMERLSALRNCQRTPAGYRITPELAGGLAKNLKLIGVWEWGDFVIPGNHLPAVQEDVFLPAYELAMSRGKPKGRAINHDPLEWAGLLWCCNHPYPEPISSHACDGDYCCQRDYMDGRGHICLNISHRFIDGPLTSEVLRRLDFTPYLQAVLAKLEDEAIRGKVDGAQRNRELAELGHKLENLKSYLGCGDPEREEVYWGQFRETKQRLEDLRNKPVPGRMAVTADVEKVRQLLTELPGCFQSYRGALRNRLLKAIVDKVELRHDRQHIEATVVWKAGFEQVIFIQRPPSRSGREKRWTDQEDILLKMLWPSSSHDSVLAALSGRSWTAIAGRALRLGLRRKRQYCPPQKWRRWDAVEDEKLRLMYEAGCPMKEIANDLSRSIDAIETRAALRKYRRPSSTRWKKREVSWDTHSLVPMETTSSDR